jgi:hypothetical protein
VYCTVNENPFAGKFFLQLNTTGCVGRCDARAQGPGKAEEPGRNVDDGAGCPPDRGIIKRCPEHETDLCTGTDRIECREHPAFSPEPCSHTGPFLVPAIYDPRINIQLDPAVKTAGMFEQRFEFFYRVDNKIHSVTSLVFFEDYPGRSPVQSREFQGKGNHLIDSIRNPGEIEEFDDEAGIVQQVTMHAAITLERFN